MKVLILSTYERSGGAAIAAGRLLHALQMQGVEATMLCRENVAWWRGKAPQSWSSVMERGVVWLLNGFRKRGLWAMDLGLFGQDVTCSKEYREADVIHLHWVNQGFISLGAIERFVRDGKRVVWTMHDEWPLDSVWHYTYGGERVMRWILERKRRVYSLPNRITFVTCSEWLRRISEKKPLAQGQRVVSIPNCIDSDVFRPMDAMPSDSADERRVMKVLFVAQNVNDERKGIRYLDAAVDRLQGLGVAAEVIALGRDIPYISDVNEMARLYASVDCFVTPSLQDNLPNTIMEAMACGTPCVGFDVGGIPEMIDHRVNGYVARYKDADDLAEGIAYVLGNRARLGMAAREKVLREYSERSVARRYMDVYVR